MTSMKKVCLLICRQSHMGETSNTLNIRIKILNDLNITHVEMLKEPKIFTDQILSQPSYLEDGF